MSCFISQQINFFMISFLWGRGAGASYAFEALKYLFYVTVLYRINQFFMELGAAYVRFYKFKPSQLV